MEHKGCVGCAPSPSSSWVGWGWVGRVGTAGAVWPLDRGEPEVWAGVASGGSFLGPPFLLWVDADGPSQAGPHVETWRRGEWAAVGTLEEQGGGRGGRLPGP